MSWSVERTAKYFIHAFVAPKMVDFYKWSPSPTPIPSHLLWTIVAGARATEYIYSTFFFAQARCTAVLFIFSEPRTRTYRQLIQLVRVCSAGCRVYNNYITAVLAKLGNRDGVMSRLHDDCTTRAAGGRKLTGVRSKNSPPQFPVLPQLQRVVKRMPLFHWSTAAPIKSQ